MKLTRRNFLKTTLATVASTSAFSLFAEKPNASTIGSGSVEGITPDFKFGKNGKFKILQLADTHYVGLGEFPKGSKKASMATKEHAEQAIKNITHVLQEEKPDLVIHTGDILYGAPAFDNVRELLSPMAKLKIPFAVTLGNHDQEFGPSRQEIFDFIRTLPSCVNTPSPQGVYGVSNNVFTLSSALTGKVQRVFYLFDSGQKFENTKSYEFIRPDQINWYADWSRQFTEKNGGTPISSMAFMHIPLREYNDALHDTKRIMIGHLGEEPASSQYNSGLFAASKAFKDIDTFVFGHDHDNDTALWYDGKFLIYGRFSGYDSVYSNLKPCGVRVFEFTENKDGFRSWIRLYNDEVIQQTEFPESFKSSLYK